MEKKYDVAFVGAWPAGISTHLASIVEALKAFDKIAPGLYSKNTLLCGFEAKFYSSKSYTKTVLKRI